MLKVTFLKEQITHLNLSYFKIARCWNPANLSTKYFGSYRVFWWLNLHYSTAYICSIMSNKGILRCISHARKRNILYNSVDLWPWSNESPLAEYFDILDSWIYPLELICSVKHGDDTKGAISILSNKDRLNHIQKGNDERTNIESLTLYTDKVYIL